MNNSLMGTSYRYEKKIFPDSYYHYRLLQEKRITLEREDMNANELTLYDLQSRSYADSKVHAEISKIDSRLLSSRISDDKERKKYAPFAWKGNLMIRQAALRNLLKKEYLAYEEELQFQHGLSFQKDGR